MRNTLFLILASLTLANCSSNNAEQQPASAGDAQQAATTEPASSQQQLKKYVNWDKPLYTLNSDGDTIERWFYNDKNLLIKHISEFESIEYKYDYNNLTKTTVNKSTNETSVETYTDDTFTYISVSADGYKYEYYPYNVLKSKMTADGAVNYIYNERGDIKEEAANNYSIYYEYEFDDQGRITKVTETPDNIETTYTYNADGSITENNDIALTVIDALGRMASVDFHGSEGFAEYYTYEGNRCETYNQQRFVMNYSDDFEPSDEDTSPTITYTYYLTQDEECKPRGNFSDYKYSLE